MKKLIISSLTLLLMISLLGCSNNKLEQFKETTFDVGFNTPFTMIAYTESQEDFDIHFEKMKEEVRWMNSLFDIYNTYEGVNNIKTINDFAGEKPVKVDKMIIDLIKEAKDYTEVTQYKFDPTLGAVLEIWHAAREVGIILNQENKPGISPSQEVLEAAAKYVGWDYVEINEAESTVYINNKNASLDLGGIAKGFAVEQAALTLEANGIKHGVVNGGGNVRTIGSKLDNVPWVVGVTNPNNNDHSSLLSLAFNDSMSIVTSGDYERFFIDEDGNHQHHLIDSKTLQPSRVARSITITTKDSTLADVLSTAFSMTPLDEVLAFTKHLDIEDLGIVYVFDTKQENEDFPYLEVDGMFVYYNEVISENIFKK